MTLILDRLSACTIDRIAQAQAEIFKIPVDGVNFLLDKERCMQLFILNERTAGIRRLYAVNNELAQELGDIIRQYCFIPFRTEQGAVGMMQINLHSHDGYSASKRGIIESDFAVFTTERLKDSYVFTESDDINILPITDDEYKHILELAFAESIIESREHPIFKKYVSQEALYMEKNNHEQDKNACENVMLKKAPPEDDYIFNIDLSLETINDVL
ncbi:hypothetical protein JGK42_002080 [Aeromonas veronii]|nr:hypothetical protein [Aeromonas veronii]